MSTPQIIITELCPYCSKPRSPRDIIRHSTFKICITCRERHLQALTALTTGKYMGNCSECNRSMEEINALQGGGDNGTRMVIHYENGIYRPMCLMCDRTYVPKRADLYGDTEYGRQRGM